MPRKALQKEPTKSTHTPVFCAGPSSSLSAANTAQKKGLSRQASAYLDKLSKAHVAIAQRVTEVPSSQPSSQASGGGEGNGNEGKGVSGKSSRVDAIRKGVREAYQAANGEPADGRWAFVSQRLQMGVTRGRYRWIGTRTDGKTPQPGKGFINAETEEQWFDWEEKRRAEDELRDKIERWQKSIKSPERSTTRQPRKSSSMSVVPATEEQPTKPKNKAKVVATKSAPAAAQPSPPVKASKARDPKDPSPLGFSVVKKSTVSLSAKPRSSPRLAGNKSNDQGANPPQKPGQTKGSSGNKIKSTSPKKEVQAVSVAKKHIGDLSETAFFPPSFPTQLATSTPHAQPIRAKPAPILFPPNLTSSPLSSPPPTYPRPVAKDQSEQRTLPRTNVGDKRRRSVSTSGPTPMKKPRLTSREDDRILVPSSSNPALSSNGDAPLTITTKDGKVVPVRRSRRLSMAGLPPVDTTAVPIVDLSQLSLNSNRTPKRQQLSFTRTPVTRARSKSQSVPPSSSIVQPSSPINANISTKGKGKEKPKEPGRSRSVKPNRSRGRSRSRSRARNSSKPKSKSQARKTDNVPAPLAQDQQQSNTPGDAILNIPNPRPKLTTIPIPADSNPPLADIDDPPLPLSMQDPHLMQRPYEVYTDINLSLDTKRHVDDGDDGGGSGVGGYGQTGDENDGDGRDYAYGRGFQRETYVDYFEPIHGEGHTYTGIPEAPRSLTSLEDSDEEEDDPWRQGSDPSGVYDDVDEEEDIEEEFEGSVAGGNANADNRSVGLGSEVEVIDEIIEIGDSDDEGSDDEGGDGSALKMDFTKTLDVFDPPFASTQANGAEQGQFVGLVGGERRKRSNSVGSAISKRETGISGLASTRVSRTGTKQGLQPGSSGVWMGYNSQFDVDGQIEKVSRLLEEDVDLYGFGGTMRGNGETGAGVDTRKNGMSRLDPDMTDVIEDSDED